MKLILIEIVRQKKFVLLLALFLILLNAAFMLFMTSYQEPALVSSRSKWSELRNLVARAGHADASSLYRRGKADLETLNTRVPLKREFARLLGDIIETASDSGVAIGSITYKPISIKDEALLSYQLSVSVNGSYAAVKSCLADLLQNPEFMVVESVALTNGDLFIENVVMNLNLTVYLREGA